MKMNKLLVVVLLLVSSKAFCQSNLTTASLHKFGTAFTCITVDKNGNVWAGTNKLGLFYLDNSMADPYFEEVPATPVNFKQLVIQTITADSLGNLWVGHAGFGGSTNGSGGLERLDINSLISAVHYSPDRNAQCMPSFLQRDGLGTLNVSCIAVDKYNTVWAAQKSHSLTSGADFILTPGTLSAKPVSSELFYSMSTWEDFRDGKESPELPYPAYTCEVPVSKTPGSRRCESVACSNTEVWMSVYPYEYASERDMLGNVKATEYLPARILRYNLSGQFIGQYTFEDIGATTGGVFNAIHLTKNSNAWVGLTSGKGLGVRIKGCWYLLNSATMPEIFESGLAVNVNAIWGNNQGLVFIGTNKGLIVYNGVGNVEDPASYTVIKSTAEGLLRSDNITGGSSENDTTIWVATDMGVNKIVSDNNFSLDDNYTSCNNPAINAIEVQTKDKANMASLDWHNYEVVTEICTSTGPNGANCNAQYIYNMMKADASLTAPIPLDFPFDTDFLGVGIGVLKMTADQLESVLQRIASQKVPILSLAFLYVDIVEEGDQKTQQIPFGNVLNNNKDYLALQKASNPFAVVPCARYKLYNNSALIIGRTKYNKYVDNMVCGNGLESVEYDPVWIYPDDKNLVITNYTAPGHFLSPGKIERRVIEECGTVKIVTQGTGRQYCGSNPVGGLAGIGNILTGRIAFKNVDLRLKEAFSNK